jgi:hypothetical protein
MHTTLDQPSIQSVEIETASIYIPFIYDAHVLRWQIAFSARVISMGIVDFTLQYRLRVFATSPTTNRSYIAPFPAPVIEHTQDIHINGTISPPSLFASDFMVFSPPIAILTGHILEVSVFLHGNSVDASLFSDLTFFGSVEAMPLTTSDVDTRETYEENTRSDQRKTRSNDTRLTRSQ